MRDTTQTRVQDQAQIDRLIQYGMARFAEAGIGVSPSRLSKIAKAGLRAGGYRRAKADIIAFFERRANYELASYEKALRIGSVRNIARFKKNAPAGVAAPSRGEDSNR